MERIMNARSYRVNLIVSPLDFPTVNGIVENSVIYNSEPFMNNSKVLLKITNKFIFHNIDNKKEHEVLSVESVYEIPCSEIRSREDVYEFYKDATLGLDEVYKYLQSEIPLLPSRPFPNQPIQNYQGEIDRVFNLLNRRN
jgi:hypothetical protein